MILEKQIENDVLSFGEENESIEMTIALDEESQQFLMSTLSENLYSDEIGSPIREYSSNALDSHREAGVSDPIIVKFGISDSGNYEFSVEDFGIGLDDEDVRNILSKYGASTKRKNANVLGMFGLGFKSGLAYTKSSFIFIARKNGIERKYMMYNSESGKSIDLLYKEPTTERNGVKVIIPVKREDRYTFIEKIQEQLAYFENVYFDVDGISNDFKIFRNELFQFSELENYREMHLCLDNVYYPIDWKSLGISKINMNVGLRFSLTDGIYPTPNREAIQMTKEAKEIILNRIKEVADYFVNEYNATAPLELHSYYDILDYYSDVNKYVMVGETQFIINSLASISTIPIKEPFMKGVDKISLYDDVYKNRHKLFNNYEKAFNIRYGKITKRGRWGNWDVDINKDKNYYLCVQSPSLKIREYIKDKLWQNNNYFIRRLYNIKLFPPVYSSQKNYYNLLSLDTHPRSEWRERIMELQSIISPITEKFVPLVENSDIPTEWLENRKKKIQIKILSDGTLTIKERRKKFEGEFSAKIAVELEKYTGNHCKFTSETFQLKDFHKKKHLYIYGKEEDKTTLDKLYAIFSRQNIRLLILSEREYNNISKIKLHNLMPLTEFKNGNSAPFRRAITAHLINKLIGNFDDCFMNIELFEKIDPYIWKKMEVCKSYEQRHYGSEEMLDSFLNMAEENSLFDWNVHPDYLEVKKFLETFPFIEFFINKLHNRRSYSYASEEERTEMTNYINDLIRYNKLKPKLNEMLTSKNVKETVETVTELTEETINNLEEQLV